MPRPKSTQIIEKCIKSCEGCIRKKNDNTCMGWISPADKWGQGKCEAYSQDSNLLAWMYSHGVLIEG